MATDSFIGTDNSDSSFQGGVEGKKIIFNAGVEAVSHYVDNKKNYSPKIQLLFSPFGLPYVPIEIIGSNINDIITDLNWTKDRNNPGGILQISLVPDAHTIQKLVNIINKFTHNLYSKIWGELGVDLEDLFKPMTLCQLWIDGYHVMTGTVRSCSRSSSVSNTDKQVSYSLLIDELGNIYNMNTISSDTIYFDGIQKQVVDTVKKAYELSGTLKGVPLSVGIKKLAEAFIITTLESGTTCSDGFPLAFRLLALANPIGGIANLSLANSMTVNSALFKLNSSGGGQASIWSFLKNLIPSPWMEFFTESGGRTIVTDTIGSPAIMFPGFNYVVARTVPYSNPLLGTVSPFYFAQLTPFELSALSMLAGGDFVIITDDIIHEKTLGFDCINQNTIFHTKYTDNGAINAADTKDKGVKTIGPLNPFASGGMSTFGAREMFSAIDSTSLAGLGAEFSYAERIAKNTFGFPLSIISKNAFSNLLAVWFRNQARFREGSVTVKGMPWARAGMYCLYMPSISGKKVDNLRDIGIYYIDTLTHNYSLENDGINFTTTLSLIRGTPLPISAAQTALLLFDYEVIPPVAGIGDSEWLQLKTLRDAISKV